MNKSLRSILGVTFNENYIPSKPTSEMYKELEMLKLKDIYKYFLLKFLHSVIYGNRSYIFNNYFLELVPTHGHNTRSFKFKYPQVRLEVERHLPVYNCVSLFNGLPDDFIKPQSAMMLKKKFKKLCLDSY